MTTNNDADNLGAGGKDQRPQVTLDLKATEVHTEPPSAEDTAAAATTATAGGAGEEPPPVEAPKRTRATFAIAGMATDIRGFATHMAAGLLGSLFALTLAYGAGAFRDPPPLPTDRNAQDFQTHISGYDARFAKQDERFATMEKAASAQRPEIAQAQSRIQALTEQANGLKQEIAALSKRLDERPAAVAAPSATPEALQQAVDPLKAKIAELEAHLAQVSKSQTEVQTDSRSSALAVALYNLRRAVNEGKPFAAELQSIATLTPVPLELAALTASREKGVRSMAQLQTSLDASANAAIDAESHTGESSYAGEIWSKAKSLVRIRRVGEVAGDDTQAVLARVEMRMGASDLRAAINEAGKLKGQAAAAFKPWLDDAQARLAVDDGLTQIEAALLTALGTENRVRKGS